MNGYAGKVKNVCNFAKEKLKGCGKTGGTANHKVVYGLLKRLPEGTGHGLARNQVTSPAFKFVDYLFQIIV